MKEYGLSWREVKDLRLWEFSALVENLEKQQNAQAPGPTARPGERVTRVT